MMIRVLLYLAIIVQFVAMYYAIRLVRRTKYNVIWFLFIVGFVVLGVERFLQLLMSYGYQFSVYTIVWHDIVVSVCVSGGIVMLDRLFVYIDRLNRHRQLTDKRILTAVLRAEEKTRSTFSKELHDGLGPLLSSAKISLSAIKREELDTERREIFDNTLYVVEEALRSLREISNNLSPHVLSDFGLARGIQNFIDRSQTLHNVKISYATNLRGERYDSDIEVIMYRVVCELITNSLKHSGCSEIRLSLTSGGDMLELQYTDNGRGFNPQSMMDCGMGLSNINSRVNSLNGEFEVTSTKGRGMRASVKVNVRGAVRMMTAPSAMETSKMSAKAKNNKRR
ncbi:MAG: sensor histidine kinase [Alistipes sp.]|jgi:signal transduction histidine kinase|nr:sensor histidine kinase [Alistipes sp.]MBQ5875941.1 sensor histidine kinase [Alistipes sp.]MBR5483503.1 sensor histidine kinase [Alistipes sp.]